MTLPEIVLGRVFRAATLTALALSGLAGLTCQTAIAQVSALRLDDVIAAARENRAEILAAHARADALAARPAIAGALEDPMLYPSIDHYPFDMMEDPESSRRYDWSITMEQRFPLSRVRSHRARAAQAEAASASALVDRALLDVALEGQQAFYMLRERRLMAGVLERQLALSRELVTVAAARYAGGTGPQADVLRAEVEASRIVAAQRALVANTLAAEAMLNVSMGQPAAAPIGEIEYTMPVRELPATAQLQESALLNRPELRAGTAEIERTTAEVDVMRSMYRPMAMIRAGPASTMAEGAGAMLMFGVSVPLWRSRLRAGVDEAQAMERMARADLTAMQRMIEGEVAAARADLQAAAETLRALESEVVPRARSAVDAALADYAAGRGTLLLVLDASRALWDIEAERLMTETQVGEARAYLDVALGNTAPWVEQP